VNLNDKKNHDFLVAPFGKFVLIYFPDGVKYFKITPNNEYIQPSNEEKLELDKVFVKKIDSFDSFYKYHQNLSIEDLIKANPELPNDKDFINLVNHIEKIIPDGCKENLYRNLSTLKILYNQPDVPGVASYNGKYNTISFATNQEETLKRTLRLETIDAQTAAYHLSSTLFHEILHMASSFYDEKTGIYYSGLSTINLGEDAIHSSRAINEGVTAMIEHHFYPECLRNTGYLEEICIAGHLNSIVGLDNILKTYFSAKGIEPIKNELYGLGVDRELIDILFPRVEINYITKEERVTSPNTALANLETTLIDCSEAKLRQMIDNGKITTEEELNNHLMVIQPNVLTTDKAPFFRRGIENCLNMNEVDEWLENLKKNIHQHYHARTKNESLANSNLTKDDFLSMISQEPIIEELSQVEPNIEVELGRSR